MKAIAIFAYLTLFVVSCTGCAEKNSTDKRIIFYALDSPSRDIESANPFSTPDQSMATIKEHNLQLSPGSKLLFRDVRYGHFGLVGTQFEHQKLQDFLSVNFNDRWRMFDADGSLILLPNRNASAPRR